MSQDKTKQEQVGELHPLSDLKILRFGIDEGRIVINIIPSGFVGMYLVITEHADDESSLAVNRMTKEEIQTQLGIEIKQS